MSLLCVYQKLSSHSLFASSYLFYSSVVAGKMYFLWRAFYFIFKCCSYVVWGFLFCFCSFLIPLYLPWRLPSCNAFILWSLSMSVSFHLAQCPTAIFKGRETPPDEACLGNLLGNLLKSPANNLTVSLRIHHSGSETAVTNSPLAHQCVWVHHCQYVNK